MLLLGRQQLAEQAHESWHTHDNIGLISHIWRKKLASCRDLILCPATLLALIIAASKVIRCLAISNHTHCLIDFLLCCFIPFFLVIFLFLIQEMRGRTIKGGPIWSNVRWWRSQPTSNGNSDRYSGLPELSQSISKSLVAHARLAMSSTPEYKRAQFKSWDNWR